MAAVSVNITDFKKELNGRENADNTLYEFPVIKSVNKLGKTIQWQIIVGLLENDKPVKIIPEYYLSKPMENKTGYYKVLSKHETAVEYDSKTPTYISSGKNLGKKNQTNVFTQALRDALSEYNKYLKKNSTIELKPHLIKDNKTDNAGVKSDDKSNDKTDDKTNDKSNDKTDDKNIQVNKILYPPMLATPLSKKIDFTKPTYIQRKYNGIRAIATFDDKQNKVILYSRGLGIYPETNLHKELYDVLKPNPNIYIDGEIYTHGMALQDISGKARGDETDKVLNYYVFDLFEIVDGKLQNRLFSERYALLKSIFSSFISLKNIHIVETYEVKSEEDVQKYYKQFLLENYEGAIVRLNTPYEFSYKSRHTQNLLKLKQLLDNEFVLTGISEGVAGKAKGAMLLEFETENGKKFTVTPKGTLEYRKQLYEKLKNTFDAKFKGRKMRVHYEELSKDGVPLRARIEEIYLRPFDE